MPAGWRDTAGSDNAGGMLYDLGSHLIDQALTLFGPANSVYAETATGGKAPRLTTISSFPSTTIPANGRTSAPASPCAPHRQASQRHRATTATSTSHSAMRYSELAVTS